MINWFINDAKRKVHRLKGKGFYVRFTQKTVKHAGGSIMARDIFSWDGVTTIDLMDGVINRFVCKDLLKTVVQPYDEDKMPLLHKFHL